MNTHTVLAVVLAGAMFFPSCTDDSSPVTTTTPPVVVPPAWKSPGVHLAVGNTYHWRFTRTSSYGNIFQWDENYSITGETFINGERFFILSTGEKLKTQGDTVLAYMLNGSSVYYRLDVSVGQTVPFIGNQLAVTFIDTSALFGETHKVVSLFNQGTSSTVFSGRYASKFGLIGIDRSEPTVITRGVLVGARIGTVNYGFAP